MIYSRGVVLYNKSYKFLITSALPYSNGKLHIGHIAGAYLPADIFNRFIKMNGCSSIFICGSDNHGVPIYMKAKELNKTPEYISQYYSEIIEKDLKSVDIQLDFFGNTYNSAHAKVVHSFFDKLYSKGYLEYIEAEQFYCENDKMFLPDRYVIGGCDKCGYINARGDECVSCGSWVDPLNLKNPICQICSTSPIIKKSGHWYFLLNKCNDILNEWIDKNSYLSNEIKNFVYEFIRSGLKQRAITRDMSWGVKLNEKYNKNSQSTKVIYVWFEALIGYISIFDQFINTLNDKDKSKYNEMWFKDSNIIHFIGKDNILFHSILFPCMLLGMGNYNTNINIISHEHLKVSNEKISTSSSNVLWVDDFIKKYPSDYLRYYLACNLSKNKDFNFDFNSFIENINSSFNDNIGNFINRVFIFIKNKFNSRIDNLVMHNNFVSQSNKYLDIMDEFVKDTFKYMELCEFKSAVLKINDLLKYSNKYFSDNTPWKTFKNDLDRSKLTLYNCFFSVIYSVILLYPIVPNFSIKILNILNLDINLSEFKWSQIRYIKIESITISDFDSIFSKL